MKLYEVVKPADAKVKLDVDTDGVKSANIVVHKGNSPAKVDSTSRRSFLKRSLASTLNDAISGLTPLKAVGQLISAKPRYKFKVIDDMIYIKIPGGSAYDVSEHGVEYHLEAFIADRDNNDNKTKIGNLIKKAGSALISKSFKDIMSVINDVEHTDLFGGECYQGWFDCWEQKIGEISEDEQETISEWNWKDLNELSPKLQKVVIEYLLEDLNLIIAKSDVWLQLADVPRVSDKVFAKLRLDKDKKQQEFIKKHNLELFGTREKVDAINKERAAKNLPPIEFNPDDPSDPIYPSRRK